MATTTDYALFAANSYAAAPNQAVISEINELPIPAGWSRSAERVNNDIGFLARAYQNGNDIVIAYGGTTFEEGMKTLDWTNGNLPGATGAALGQQVVDAAKFYLDVKALNPDAFAAANIGGTTSLGQFAGLGAGSGLPSLESFRGLHEGMARL